MFLLQYVQPGLVGLMDGSVSTLAPLFAAAFATHNTWATFLVGLAASVGAGISMGFAEALSDDGSLTGRGTPWIRGAVCGLMTTVGGIGHTLPYLIPHFWTATSIAVAVVAVELGAISYIRYRFMDTPLLSAAFQVMFGGALVFMAGILIGVRVSLAGLAFTLDDRSPGTSFRSASGAAADTSSPRTSVEARARLHQLAAQTALRPSSRGAGGLVADLKAHAPDHIALSGSRQHRAEEFAPARLARSLGKPADVSVVPGNHDAYVRAGRNFAVTKWGDYMRATAAKAFPICAGAAAGADRAFNGCRRAARRDRRWRAPAFALGPMLAEMEREGLFRVVLIHHPPVAAPIATAARRRGA